MSSSGSPMPSDFGAAGSIRSLGRVRPMSAQLGGLALACLLGWPLPAVSGGDTFDRAIREVGAFCVRGPATGCAERSFALADADRDGLVDAPEIQALKDRLQVWSTANSATLQAADLRALQLGFVLADTIGIEQGMLLYDDDGDAALSLAEATADFNLDGRPLAELVQQRELVDWPSLRRRFGATAMLFDYLDLR